MRGNFAKVFTHDDVSLPKNENEQREREEEKRINVSHANMKINNIRNRAEHTYLRS
jgi:hypothetical protein